ncbi:hypothetical protein K438DRAFT_1858114 [Mycena galopus ATCC 62051]|nr:hypothetical protein K438DRAFT_1858114 [Mycena galopus ATCC 62051]
MLLATGDALVFSPAALITADSDDRGGVGLLGRDHLTLRVRPRLTLDGGASLLAVGHSLPVHAVGSAASPLSLPTPPISESHLPTQGESRLEDTGTAPPVAAPNSTVTSTMPSAPLNTQAASSTVGHVPAPSALSVVKPKAPASSTVGHVPAPSALSVVKPKAPASSTVGHVPAPSALSVVKPKAPASAKSKAPASRTVPASLQDLMGYLLRNGAADKPLPLSDVHNAVQQVKKPGPGEKQWWTQMLQQAVQKGLIELTKDKKMIRLLERGPLVYV